ncbi:MAG: ATP-binding cassette domain-containing protein, partial [Acidimicrobiales bacterium]|nr:ATP-binding cassette domain-containing protein [Acidimicrobiales bacterium]
SSGCGKTTVLRAVAGLEAVAAGNVLVDGVDVTSVPAHRRGVGLMFQDLALFPHRDVGANVEFGLRMHGVACPGASSNGWRWPGHWRPSPGSCSSTSPWDRSTGACATG